MRMKDTKDPGKINFEKALGSLELIVERLQQENLDLDEMIRLYEEGIIHLANCQHVLENAELKIQQLNSKLKTELEKDGEDG